MSTTEVFDTKKIISQNAVCDRTPQQHQIVDISVGVSGRHIMRNTGGFLNALMIQDDELEDNYMKFIDEILCNLASATATA